MRGASSSPGAKGARCLWVLQRCLAIQLQRVGAAGPTGPGNSSPAKQGHSDHYWMYDSGYLIFQSFLEANLKCFWNASLLEAVRLLEFQGYVSPGVLLVTANPCALEVLRSAWGRNVLKAPANYRIALVGDVEDCLVQPVQQGQFTPLPEALCWVVFELCASGHSAVLDNIAATLLDAFPHIAPPSRQVIYDALANLMQDRKVYQTSQGYFIVTPETRRLRTPSEGRRSRERSQRSGGGQEERSLLMSREEALVMVHGEMETLRDGELTHQAVQTNLADVICGGNPNDKVVYARQRPAAGNRLERRHSLRLFSNSKRLSNLQRSGSCRLLHSREQQQSGQNKKMSLFSRLFRRSKRKVPPPLSTFSAQFPPTEWFNSKVVHLHSIGTQTNSPTATAARSRAGSSSRSRMSGSMGPWERERDQESAATLPRRHRRVDSSPGLATATPRSSRKASPCPVRCKTPPGSPLQILQPGLPLQDSRTPSQSSVHHTQHPSAPAISISPSRSVASSSKTLVSSRDTTRCFSSPTTSKSLSSGSSGYNSLPRSSTTKIPKPSKNHSLSGISTLKSSPVHSPTGNKSSITLQVSTNQANTQGVNKSFIQSVQSSVGESTANDNSTTMTTTINGANTTKIFVQQQNSPVRSVITFENALNKGISPPNKDVVILNPNSEESKIMSSDEKKNRPKLERPLSLYSQKESSKTVSEQKVEEKEGLMLGQVETQMKKKFPSTETILLEEKLLASNGNKNNKNQRRQLSDPSRNILKGGSLIDVTNTNFCIESEMNNVRKASLSSTRKASLSSTPLQSMLSNDKTLESLCYKNVLKESSQPFLPLLLNKDGKNVISNPPSPTKTFDLGGSLSTILGESAVKTPQDCADICPFPSLSDLSLHFTSIAAQNILKGVSINSIDTLVEVNMAAEKQNNCDVTLHTDFGLV